MVTAKQVSPDFELTIRNASNDCILVVGYFIEEDGVVDCGIGWDGETALDGLRALLATAEVALSASITFTDIDHVHSENERKKSEGSQLPF